MLRDSEGDSDKSTFITFKLLRMSSSESVYHIPEKKRIESRPHSGWVISMINIETRMLLKERKEEIDIRSHF